MCVHPPSLLRQDCDVIHHPGYLTVSCHLSPNRGSTTLRLSWIPNTTLRRNPWTVEKDENTNAEPVAARLATNLDRQGSIDSNESRNESRSSKTSDRSVSANQDAKKSSSNEEANNGNVPEVNRNVPTAVEDDNRSDETEVELPLSLCCVVLEEVSEGSEDQSRETSISARLSAQESDRYSRSPSITSTCSLVIPHVGRGPAGGTVQDDTLFYHFMVI